MIEKMFLFFQSNVVSQQHFRQIEDKDLDSKSISQKSIGFHKVEKENMLSYITTKPLKAP